MFLGASPSRSGQFLRTSSWLAPIPPEVDDHRLRAQLELTDGLARAGLPTGDRARLKYMAGHAGDGGVGDGQLVDLMAKAQLDQAALRGIAHATHERLDHPGPGAPGDVEARDGVAVPVAQ